MHLQMNVCSPRYSGPVPCPIPQCGPPHKYKRLDRHLITVHNLGVCVCVFVSVFTSRNIIRRYTRHCHGVAVAQRLEWITQQSLGRLFKSVMSETLNAFLTKQLHECYPLTMLCKSHSKLCVCVSLFCYRRRKPSVPSSRPKRPR